MQQHSSPRHPLSDVISATHVGSSAMITSQPIISGAGGGISIGGSDLKTRYYDEVSFSFTFNTPCVFSFNTFLFETLGVILKNFPIFFVILRHMFLTNYF